MTSLLPKESVNSMKREELSNLPWIGKEIEFQKLRLEELLAKAESTGQVLSGMPKSRCEKDRIADYIAAIADLRSDIEMSQYRFVQEELRMERFIDEIESSEIRLILRLRHIKGLSWEKIGQEMGYEGSTVRKKYGRFIESYLTA